jgi:hypothetical protein
VPSLSAAFEGDRTRRRIEKALGTPAEAIIMMESAGVTELRESVAAKNYARNGCVIRPVGREAQSFA